MVPNHLFLIAEQLFFTAPYMPALSHHSSLRHTPTLNIYQKLSKHNYQPTLVLFTFHVTLKFPRRFRLILNHRPPMFMLYHYVLYVSYTYIHRPPHRADPMLEHFLFFILQPLCLLHHTLLITVSLHFTFTLHLSHTPWPSTYPHPRIYASA